MSGKKRAPYSCRLSSGNQSQNNPLACKQECSASRAKQQESRMPSDIEIAQKANMQRISKVALDKLGISEDHLEPYGHYKAKVSLKYLDTLKSKKNGKLVLVTAISPTPAGEGKTTTTVGLGDALNYIGKKAMICLR